MNKSIRSFFTRLNYDLENIREKYLGFDYVYIANGQPLIGFVDNYEDSDINIKFLHKQFWNQNEVPITVVYSDKGIEIYSNFEYSFEKALIEINKNKDKYENYIDRDSIYSGRLLELLESSRKKNTRVDEVLIYNLEELAKLIKKKSQLSYEQVCNFLSWCIFIKYLEDRNILTVNTFEKFDETNFIDILNENKIGEFSKYINDKLSGNLSSIFDFPMDNFAWTNDIANFFRGDDIRTGQMSLFGYDFSLIPVELISNIYEKFLNLIQSIDEKKKLGNFYTPYYLARHIIDEAFNKVSNINKVLDPACGSGVFLVSSYKKMCTSDLSDDEKENIIGKRIFGVDVNGNSLKITSLSLYIAYLDSIEPKDIEISKKKLPILLGKTLIKSDFFDKDILLEENSFDLVVGNPPWISIKGKHLDYIASKGYSISDNQIAQSFMYRALDYLTGTGLSALIITNSAFFSSKSAVFRRTIFKLCDPVNLINLQNIKNSLFSSASSPASIIYTMKESRNKTLGYYNYKNNLLSGYTGKIVFDYSQLIHFPLQLLDESPDLWDKISFASSFDIDVLQKIEMHKPLIDFLDEYDLIISQGYAVPSDVHDFKNEDLVGLPIYTDKGVVGTNRYTSFERIHDKRIYFSSNKLLISRTLSHKRYDNAIYTDIVTYPCIFNNKFYAITHKYEMNFNHKVTLKLKNIDLLMKSSIYLYYQYFVSEAWKNTHPEIRMERIKKFPVPVGFFSSTIDSTDKLFDLYGFNSLEKEIINQTCSLVINKDNSVSDEYFINTYCQNVAYQLKDFTNIDFKHRFIKDKFYSRVIFYESDHEIEASNLAPIDDFFGTIALREIEENVIINLPIYLFEEKSFSIIKPNDISNWNIRTAINDVHRLIKRAFEDEVK